MIDKNPPDQKAHDFEEEFDFDSNELFETGADPLNPVVPAQPSFFERAKWPILIGAVITAFMGWKLYDVLFPSTADAQIDKVAQEESAAINASAPSAVVPAPAPVSSEPVIVTPTPPVVSEPALSVPFSLEKPAPEEVRHLENTVNQMMDSLTKMDQKMSLIGREFFTLSEQVARLSQEMAALKNKPKAPFVNAPLASKPKKPSKASSIVPKVQPVYSVEQAHEESEEIKPTQTASHKKSHLVIHAIIPGRVWLKGPDGSTFTVTTGEIIPGYGKAMVIDAPSASVVTSSGVVLR